MKMFLLISSLILFVIPTHAQVLPPGSVVDGKSIGEWTAEWWKWIYQAPTNQNPHLETSGAWAHFRQPEGNVFLLAGVPGTSPETVARTFTVPESKYLLMPVLIIEVDNIDAKPSLTIPELRQQAEAYISNPKELHANIDGIAVPNLLDHREISPVFSIFFTNADNFATWNYGRPILDLVDPMLSDGYWLMIEPLSLGSHVLHYGGSYSNDTWFPNNIVANINVVPAPASEHVRGLIVTLETSNLRPKKARGLMRLLKRAASALESNRFDIAIARLGTFQGKVGRVYRDDVVQSEKLIQRAQTAIDRTTTEFP